MGAADAVQDFANGVVAQAEADGIDFTEVLTREALLAEKYKSQDIVAEIFLDSLIGDIVRPSEVMKALESMAGYVLHLENYIKSIEGGTFTPGKADA